MTEVLGHSRPEQRQEQARPCLPGRVKYPSYPGLPGGESPDRTPTARSRSDRAYASPDRSPGRGRGALRLRLLAEAGARTRRPSTPPSRNRPRPRTRQPGNTAGTRAPDRNAFPRNFLTGSPAGRAVPGGILTPRRPFPPFRQDVPADSPAASGQTGPARPGAWSTWARWPEPIWCCAGARAWCSCDQHAAHESGCCSPAAFPRAHSRGQSRCPFAVPFELSLRRNRSAPSCNSSGGTWANWVFRSQMPGPNAASVPRRAKPLFTENRPGQGIPQGSAGRLRPGAWRTCGP